MRLPLLLSFVLLFSLSSEAQKWHLFTEAGIVEPLETIEDQGGTVTWSINTSPILVGGIQRRHRRIEQSLGYHFMNYWTTAPRWIDDNVGGTSSGPNYIHSLFYRLGVDLMKPDRRMAIIPNVQVRLGYLPDNKWDNNSVPLDSALLGYGSIGTVRNGDTVTLYSNFDYNRLMSDILFNVSAGLEFRFFNRKRINLSIIPQYSHGLVLIHQADTWYTDFIKGKSGHAILTAHGSHVGVLGKLTLQLNK
jgi:hypothetical protein